MSAKKKSGMDYIEAATRQWDEWKKANPSAKDNAVKEPPEVIQIRQIAKDLNQLRWKDATKATTPSSLSLAICDERWDLVRKATWVMEREWLPRDDPGKGMAAHNSAQLETTLTATR